MKGNTISLNTLNECGKIWIGRSLQILKVQEYGKESIRNYTQELTLLFKFYNNIPVEELRQEHIEKYLLFIKENHKIGRAKCRSVAQACSFFFKKVMPTAYIVPSILYPKKQFILPDIMTEMQVEQLFQTSLTLKERCVVGLLYGAGMRISEVCNLIITDIDSSNQRIKVVQGKGGKDRFTRLPITLLTQLRAYYLAANRPKEFLRRFEQQILPNRFVKIRYSGFLSHQNKNERLKSICEQLKISPPPPKVQLPNQVLATMTYGTDITQCSVCKIGKLERIASYVNVAKKGVKLVNAKDLNNRGSPQKITRGV